MFKDRIIGANPIQIYGSYIPIPAADSGKRTRSIFEYNKKTDQRLEKEEEEDKRINAMVEKLSKTIPNQQPQTPANDYSSSPTKLSYPVDYYEVKQLIAYVIDSRYCKRIRLRRLLNSILIWVIFIFSFVMVKILFQTDHTIWLTIFCFIATMFGAVYLIPSIASLVIMARFNQKARNGRMEGEFSHEAIIEFAIRLTDSYNEYEKKQAEKDKAKKCGEMMK